MNKEETRVVVTALCREIRLWTQKHQGILPEVVFIMPGDASDSAALREFLAKSIPELGDAAKVIHGFIENGRYYDLKNEGARLSSNEVVIFLDSDTELEDGWLIEMASPFSDASLQAASGFTYLQHSGLLSRTYALTWIFPLRNGDERFEKKRALNANNCAFRRSFFLKNLFPDHAGFKVSCSLVLRRMQNDNVRMARLPAYASHKAPEGLRFYLWRALVTGRDNDRRYAAMRSSSRPARILHSFSRLFTMLWRSWHRIATKHAIVGMPLWQVPASMIIASLFYVIAFVGQFALASGLARDKIEYIPKYVHVS